MKQNKQKNRKRKKINENYILKCNFSLNVNTWPSKDDYRVFFCINGRKKKQDNKSCLTDA